MTNKTDQSYFDKRIINELGLNKDDYSIRLSVGANKEYVHEIFSEDKDGNITITPFTLDRRLIEYDHPKATPEKPNIYNERPQTYSIKRLKNPVKYNGNSEIRYLMPKGQGTYPFFTPKLVEKFEQKEKIKTLYLTEGVFKQFAGYKNGLDIVGLSSITHYKDNETGKLYAGIISIIKACKVENVAIIYDGDCRDISKHALEKREDVTFRSKSFISSALKIRELLKDFDIQFYFCHVKSDKIPGNPKGLDNLLFAHREKADEIIEDLMSFSGTGKYFFKQDITIKYKNLYDYFKVNQVDEFYEFHKQNIGHQEFNFKGRYYQWNDEDEALQQNCYQDDIPIVFNDELKFWYKSDKDDSLHFDYFKCYKFLEANNFFRYVTVKGDFIFIHIRGKIVYEVQPYEIKDFITKFLEIREDPITLNMIYRGGQRYVGPLSVANLSIKTLDFHKSEKNRQCLYFKNYIWEITGKEIKRISYSDFPGYIWAEQIIDFEPELIESLINIQIDSNDKLTIDIDKKSNSHFLQFLLYTSKIYWKEEIAGTITDFQIEEHEKHLLNKLSALGYLLHNYRDDSQTYAVIAMDNQISDVGDSNGGTGKSLLGFAVKVINPTIYIPGKKNKLFDDPFIWQNVTEKTKYIFIDDVRQSFDFEFLYPVITGQMSINPKVKSAFLLPKDKTPKIYISTNHAININGDSDIRRQFKIGFSNYYNKNRTPATEFGYVLFSQEWPKEQWDYFYNICAYSVQAYLKFGKREAPGQNLKLRELRQQMGEEFYQWAELYFSDPLNLNTLLIKTDLYNYFKERVSLNVIKYYTPTRFKRCVKAFCEYKGFLFNPEQNGEDNKSNGTEYIVIGTKKKEAND